MNTESFIHLESVNLRYNNDTQVLQGINLDLQGGSICALVGVNGSGKSTLFKTIMGFVQPQSGSVRIMGMPIARALKKGVVAYVPQQEKIDWHFPVTVRDVVMMGRYGMMGLLRRPKTHDHQAVQDALKRVDMEGYAGREIGALSGGQKKRVFLARALAQIAGQANDADRPKIILLDEPFTGVDVKTENKMIEIMRQLRTEGHLMLVATHNLGAVPDYCDHVALINHSVVAAGPLETTFTQDNLAKTFGGMLRHIHLEGDDLHDDEDTRSVMVITDDERPLVLYGDQEGRRIIKRRDKKDKAND